MCAKYQAWDDVREGGASLTMLEFAVDLGWNCFAEETHNPIPVDTFCVVILDVRMVDIDLDF